MSRNLQAPGLTPAIAVACAAAAALADALLPAEAHRIAVAVHVVGLLALMIAAVDCWRWWSRTREALAALEHREAQSRAIIEGAGEVIMVIDDQATIVSFNRAAERMFGYAAEEVVGGSLERLMTDGARRHHAAYLAEHGVTAMVEAAKLRTVHKGVRKRGEVFPFELSMTEWSDGGRRMFTGVMRDVTDQQRTADDLRETQARYAGVFEHFPEPLFIFLLAGDGSFVLETMNGAAEAWTGQSRFAAVGQAAEAFAAAEHGRLLRRALLNALTAAGPATETLTLRTPGGPQPASLTVSPMRDAAGEVRRVLVSAPATDCARVTVAAVA